MQVRFRDAVAMLAILFIGLNYAAQSFSSDPSSNKTALIATITLIALAWYFFTYARTPRTQLDVAQNLVIGYQGGVLKRLDDNRELLELLRHHAPDVLHAHSAIEEKLRAQDDFLVALANTFPASKLHAKPHNYPRQWPTR